MGSEMEMGRTNRAVPVTRKTTLLGPLSVTVAAVRQAHDAIVQGGL